MGTEKGGVHARNALVHHFHPMRYMVQRNCAAATECHDFCRAELANVKSLIGKEYKVDRVKHIIADGQRCVYKITK